MTAVAGSRAVPRTRYVVPLALTLLGLAICAALWTIGPSKPGKFAPAFLRGYVVAWVCYVAAAVIVSRAARVGGPAIQRGVLLLIVGAALAMRLVAYVHAPRLSTDSYRYLWDGRVTNAGINPYRYPPNAREERFLRNDNWWPIAYKKIPTVYPPAAELLFAGLARLRSSDRMLFQWCFLLLDMGSVLLLAALLWRTGRPPEHVIWYAWSPLVVTEVAAGAHVDAVGVFFLILALLLIARRERAGAGSAVAYALSVLAKGPSAITLPLFARRGGWRFLAVCAVVTAALCAPFAGVGGQVFSGIHSYLEYWYTNSSLFRLLCWALEKTDPLHAPQLANGAPNYIPVVRPVMTLLTVAFVVVLAWRGKPTIEWLLAATFATLAVQLLLGAPVLPWYVIWTVPALCWWNVPGWLVFTLTVSVGYYARWLPQDIPHDWLLWMEYSPVYGLLAWQVKEKVRRKKAKGKARREG